MKTTWNALILKAALVAKDDHSGKHGKWATYSKSSILGDLAEIVRERNPAEIFVTHAKEEELFWLVPIGSNKPTP